LFLLLYKFIVVWISLILEIIDRTTYVQIILHHGFYNLYDSIRRRKKPLIHPYLTNSPFLYEESEIRLKKGEIF